MPKPVKRAATVTDLLAKKPRTKVVPIVDEDGNELQVSLRAIGSKRYDDMLAEHPPTKAQKADGGVYNIHSFAPALLSACMTDPAIEVEQATELWNSPAWSRGELLDLFFTAIEINNKGLDVPFTDQG